MNTDTTMISEEVLALLRTRDPIYKATCDDGEALAEIRFKLSKDDLTNAERTSFQELELKREKFLEVDRQLASVCHIITLIPDNILKNSNYCSSFNEKVEKESEKQSLVLREEAAILGISPQAILKAYSTRIKNDGKGPGINRSHLEVFSLLFRVSPFYLIGLTDEPGEYFIPKFDEMGILSEERPYKLIVPMDLPEPEIIKLTSYIVMRLFQSDEKMDMDDQELLSLFISICDAKYNHRLKMKETLLNIPRIKRIKNDPSGIPQYDSEQWFAYLCKMTKVSSSIHVFQEALLRLGEKDLDFLDLMARILASPIEIKKVVCDIINVGGFRNMGQCYYGFTVCSTNENSVPNVSVSEEFLQKCAQNANDDPPAEHPDEH